MLKNNKKNNNNDNNNYRTKTVKCRFNLFPGNHILIFAITVFSLLFWFIHLSM